jgi:ferredoxin-NADP reductase
MNVATSTAPAILPTVSATGEELTLRVDRADAVADDVRRLILSDTDGRRLPDWAPGAHIDVHLPGEHVRQYSLCGDRWDAYTYQIAVLREPNSRGGSAYIHDGLHVGDRVGIGGPRNNFAMAPATSYLFVAGGIGITPLLPMIQQAQILGVDWSLLYGGRCASSMAFTAELARHGERVTCWPQNSHGLLPLREAFAELPTGAKIYCCGPAPLLAAVENLGAGLPTGTVRIERFVAETLPAPARTAPFDVRLQRSGRTVTVRPGESVLDAVAAAGVPVLSSCGRGLCGTCETTVLEGVPDHRDSLLNNDERVRGASMLPCVSRACSDRLVLDL